MVDLTDKLLEEKEKLLKEKINNSIVSPMPRIRREHLGMSIIGDECYRKIFMRFRWFDNKKIDSRKRRIFDLGDILENYIIRTLKDNSMGLWEKDKNGNQFKSVNENNLFFKGSWDGVIKLFDDLYLLEIKTYNNSRFNQLKKSGVRISDFKYYAQVQCYMHKSSKTNVDKALFIAYNKNTSEIYTEIIEYDDDIIYKAMSEKANIIVSGNLEDFDKHDKTFYKCKMCEMNLICHKNKLPSKNCRTCIYSEPLPESGKFVCNLSYGENYKSVVLNYETQLNGCSEYCGIIDKK